MTEPNSQTEKPEDQRRYDPELLKKGLRCDLDQYEMLKRCSDNKDTTEWNKWRRKYPNMDIYLQGGDFCGWYLQDVNFKQGGDIAKSETEKPTPLNNEVHLEEAHFDSAVLDGANFLYAHLENARFLHAQAKCAYFCHAHLSSLQQSLNSLQMQS